MQLSNKDHLIGVLKQRVTELEATVCTMEQRLEQKEIQCLQLETRSKTDLEMQAKQ